MRNRLILLLVFLTLLSGGYAYAQNLNVESFDENEAAQGLATAKDLYNKGMFASAEQLLDLLSKYVKDRSSLLYSEIMANKMLCTVALGRADTEGLAKNFTDEFPNNPKGEVVEYYLARNRFEAGEYKSALDIFEHIDPKFIYKELEAEYHFEYGYSALSENEFDKATEQFSYLENESMNQYSYPALYYTGFAHYANRNFKEACSYFEKSKKDSRFSELSEYYIIESKFLMKDYDYVIANGEKLIPKMSSTLKDNLSRIISEAYYSKGDIENADRFFDNYTSSGVSLSAKDRYYAGLLAYSMGEYEEAVDAFAEVANYEDAMGQSAAYYSANSHLQLKNKIGALASFKKASELDEDAVIKEDAFFNYAKLSFDVNRDVSKFDEYVKQYPNSGKDDIIKSYMSLAFLNNKEYASAIEMIGQIKNPSEEVKANLQTAQVMRAIQLMNNGGYSSAISLLVSAIEINPNSKIAPYANYLYAECLYRSDKFSAVVQLGKILTADKDFQKSKEYQQFKYDLGYAYFKLEDFDNAGIWFERYLQTNNRKDAVNKDATLRLADVYFMQSKYSDAAAKYQNVISRYRDGDLYPYYQTAIAYGLNGDIKQKISVLEEAVSSSPTSELHSASIYELGRTYVQTGDADKASGCFERLLRTQDSIYHAKALIELAMISSNKERYSDAISYYDRIIRTFPYSSEAQDALLGMESIYQMQNKPSEYLAYLDCIGMSEVKTADEKEMMVFTAAEQIYFSGNHNAAIKQLQTFIDAYPLSGKLAQAYFYLGETYKAMNKNEIAAEMFLKCMAVEKGDWSEAATANYADISYTLGNYQQAVEAYETLTQIASSENNRIKGYVGKMTSHYGSRQYYKALQDAQSLAAMEGIDEAVVRKADYISAKSYIVLGQRNEARVLFAKLAENTIDEIGAEAQYFLIQDLYDAGDFVNVENKVYAFSDSGTSQLYWLAKSFILLGDSFADREEWKQARATFESIKDGYQATSSDDDVLEQVEMRLSKLKTLGK